MNKQWEFRKDGFVYCTATGERVCSPHSTLPDSIKKFGPHKQDLKANARLIAAAPELLEALRVFVSCAYPVSTEIDERGHRWAEAYLEKALPVARAAIAKAEENT